MLVSHSLGEDTYLVSLCVISRVEKPATSHLKVVKFLKVASTTKNFGMLTVKITETTAIQLTSGIDFSDRGWY